MRILSEKEYLSTDTCDVTWGLGESADSRLMKRARPIFYCDIGLFKVEFSKELSVFYKVLTP